VQVTDVPESENSPPTNLNSYGPVEIAENESIGSVVGYFQAIDPDGDEIFFFLVNGEGDEGNELFGLTEDGELWSKTSFNYENATTHSIRVVAVDSYGLSVEKSFVVKVKDVTVPMVETEIPVLLDNGRVLVGGKMISSGPVEQTGVYISERPMVRTDDENVRKVVVRSTDDIFFERQYNPIGKKGGLYVMAYARNEEGESYGLEEYVDLEIRENYDYLTDATMLDDAPGWWESPWFGTYYRSDSGWILHLELGWLYPSPSAGSGLWLWKDSLGWLWTEEPVYPYLYSSDMRNWFYFFGEYEQSRLLYDYGNKNWVKLDEYSIDETEEAR